MTKRRTVVDLILLLPADWVAQPPVVELPIQGSPSGKFWTGNFFSKRGTDTTEAIISCKDRLPSGKVGVAPLPPRQLLTTGHSSPDGYSSAEVLVLGIRLGILKFSELDIFILNQIINRLIQHPPARLEKATSQEVAFFCGLRSCLSRLWWSVRGAVAGEMALLPPSAGAEGVPREGD